VEVERRQFIPMQQVPFEKSAESQKDQNHIDQNLADLFIGLNAQY